MKTFVFVGFLNIFVEIVPSSSRLRWTSKKEIVRSSSFSRVNLRRG